MPRRRADPVRAGRRRVANLTLLNNGLIAADTADRHPSRRACANFQPATPGLPPLVIFPPTPARGPRLSRFVGAARRFTVLIMQYPGRQDRMRERRRPRRWVSWRRALDEFVAAGYTDPGHLSSATAWVPRSPSVRPSRRAAGVPVARLVASARGTEARSPTCRRTLRRRGSRQPAGTRGTGGSVMGSDAVPDARCRSCAAATTGPSTPYSCNRPDVRISAPVVVVVGGADDPVIKPHHLHHWGSHAEHVQVSVVDGDHFLPQRSRKQLLDALLMRPGRQPMSPIDAKFRSIVIVRYVGWKLGRH